MRVPFVATRELDIFISPDIGAHSHTLLVLGGRMPEPEWLRDLAGRNSAGVWAVDSGVGSCRRSGLSPQGVIGDMDSAAQEDLNWARDRGAIERLFSSDKDLTDFQLALGLWEEERRAGDSMIVSGCFGGRLDHLFSAINTFSPKLAGNGRERHAKDRRCMADDVEGIFFVCDGETVEMDFRRWPLSISLLPFTDRCDGVSVSGVRWPLNDATLSRGFPWAVSNEVCPLPGEEENLPTVRINISCGEGVLAAYWSFAQ
ncbi:MAG: thiamine diphosphokinase [Synergistaceae bacterium]|jgi:thiamine pyrophosphokinase|nr:thiamine diphosphokinase [Synergistaceae bacterium]